MVSIQAHKPSVWIGLSLFFTLMGVNIAGAVFIAVEALDVAAGMLLITAADSVLVLIWLLPTSRYVRPSLATAGPIRWYPIAAAAGVVTFLVAYACVEALTSLLPIPEVSYSTPFLTTGYGWWVVIVVICVQPALIEELTFRGVIFTNLSGLLGGCWGPVLISAVMFTALHMSPISSPHLFLIGATLGYLRHKSGSLYPCILMHFVHNSLVLLAEAIGG